jgi:hypothetical protein
MVLKVVVTYYAYEGDWDIEETLQGRKVSEATEDLKEMFNEDTHFIWQNGDVEISEAKNAL